MLKRVCTAVGTAVLVVVAATYADAQVTIVSPAQGTRLPAGPDYATDVLGDPWDMQNKEDVSPDPAEHNGWAQLGFSGGWFGGSVAPVSGIADTTATFLYRGFYGILNPVRSGLRHPIDPNRYRKLSFKMRSSAAGETVQVYWFHRPLGDPAGIGYGVRNAGQTTGADNVHVADLGTSLLAGEAWAASVVRGLRIDPNSARTDQQVFFDWIRLTAPDGAAGAAMHTIQWSGGSGTTTIDVIDQWGAVSRVATGVSGTAFAWNYGVMPPGLYTLRLQRGTSPAATRAFSINAPPLVRVTDPDESGGADFATDVLANPWDMQDAADVPAYFNIGSASFSGGFFRGVSNASGDPSIFMFTTPNNRVPIDSNRYRYLTFDLQVDGPYNLALGSVARVFWGSQTTTTAANMTTTKDIIVWPGLNRFTVDLGSLSLSPTGGLNDSGARQVWNAAPIRHLRIDPHEFPESRPFHLGRVRLAAMDEANASFRVTFGGGDADGDAATVSLYYDANTNPADGRALIVSGLGIGAGGFTWNTASVPPGVYYVSAVASDGINTFTTYSTGPVRVNGGAGASDVLMSLDTPAHGATLASGFTVAGWAIDRAAASGTGVDAIHVYAYPNPGSGAAPRFLGAAGYGVARADIGNAFGSRFTNSGFSLASGALAAGTYQIVAFARSTVSGSFTASDSAVITVTASSSPQMALDVPAPNTVVTQPFTVAGWAVDRASSSGTGVDAIHVYAYPNPGSGAAPRFLGAAGYGVARADIGNAFGARFRNSGFGLSVSGLGAGTYQIVAFARSTVTGTFNNSASAVVRVSAPAMSVDTPRPNTTVTRPFAIAGWAVDVAAPSGTGVDAVHVWAYPVSGASPIFLGAASYGFGRSDVGAMFGARFTNSGYNLSVSNLAPGTYDLAVYARSTLANAFNNIRLVRVIVR